METTAALTSDSPRPLPQVRFRRVDRYGFFVDSDDEGDGESDIPDDESSFDGMSEAASTVRRRKDPLKRENRMSARNEERAEQLKEKEIERTKKWVKMLKLWSKYYDQAETVESIPSDGAIVPSSDVSLSTVGVSGASDVGEPAGSNTGAAALGGDNLGSDKSNRSSNSSSASVNSSRLNKSMEESKNSSSNKGTSITSRSSMKGKHRSRPLIFRVLLPFARSSFDRRYDKLRRRVRKGIPDMVRGYAWFKFSGGDRLRAAEQSSGELYHNWEGYQHQSSAAQLMAEEQRAAGGRNDAYKLHSDVIDEINRDIDRTFPRHIFFESIEPIAPASSPAPSSADSRAGLPEQDKEESVGVGVGDEPRDIVRKVGGAGTEAESAETDTSEDKKSTIFLPPPPAAIGTRKVLPVAAELENREVGVENVVGVGKMTVGGGSNRELGRETGASVDKNVDKDKGKGVSLDAGTLQRNQQLQIGGQDALRRMLVRYAELDPEVGYCQGMGFIAALLLTYMLEEEAFYCYYSIMQRPSAPLRELYKSGLVEAQRMHFVFAGLMQRLLPRLAAHMENEGMHCSMYLTEWVMAMFCRRFHFDLVTRVWDAFLFEPEKGFKVVYRVCLALLKSQEKDLLARSFEKLMNAIRDIPTSIDPIEAMEIAWALPLKTAHIEELKHQFDESRK